MYVYSYTYTHIHILYLYILLELFPPLKTARKKLNINFKSKEIFFKEANYCSVQTTGNFNAFSIHLHNVASTYLEVRRTYKFISDMHSKCTNVCSEHSEIKLLDKLFCWHNERSFVSCIRVA